VNKADSAVQAGAGAPRLIRFNLACAVAGFALRVA
jgi:hypothetical protein